MKNVKDIMSKDIVWSTPDASLEEIARLMVDCDCGEIPLVKSANDMKLVGVITDRDIVCRTLGQGKNPMDFTAKDCMSAPAIAGTDNMSVEDCIELLKDNKIRRLPIVDNKGNVIGIVSQADFVEKGEDYKAVEMIHEISRPGESPSAVQ